jgi:hypothetical protein
VVGFCIVTISVLHSFVVKAGTLSDSVQARRAAGVDAEEIGSLLRAALNVCQGTSHVAATTSIHVVFVASTVQRGDHPQLPISLTLADGATLLFDEIDTRPVFEGEETEPESRVAKVVSSTRMRCGTGDDIVVEGQEQSVHRVVIAVDASTGIEVLLPDETVCQVRRECSSCFGYTPRGARCVNLRRPALKSTVLAWCHYHAAQELEFHQFLDNGQRPDCCTWWEDFYYEEVVFAGRKLGV